MTGPTRGEVQTDREVAAGARHGQRGSTRFRGDIEGLRAVAVGTVLIYHVGVPFMPGGFVGVDIFFVISGFLITSLLLREATQTGRISLADFYARRARRLLPAASLVLLCTAVAGWLVLPGQDRANVGIDVVAATFYVVNWALAGRSVDYLAEDAAPSAVQHYWSLSVEEQFYVAWPLLIMLGLFLARRTGARPKPLIFGLLAAVAAASFGYSVRHTAADPATAYFFTTTRVWELAIGALLAFLVLRLSSLPRGVAELLAGAGLALTVGSAILLSASTPWPGSWALAPTVGAALVIAAGCADQSTITARLLSLPPMVWIGGLSYAIYLWHWPLLVLAQAWNPDLRIRHLAVLGVLSIVLAWLTKHLVEDPIRFHQGLSARAPRGLLFGLATMVLTALVGLAVWATVPKLDQQAEVQGATRLIADQEAPEWTIREDLSTALTRTGPVTPDPAVAAEDVPRYYADDCQVKEGDPEINPDCVYGDPDGSRTIALLGDSKMGQWFPAIEYIAEQEGWRVELYLKSACAFSEAGVAGDCAVFTRNVLDHFAADGAPDIALVSHGARRDGLAEGVHGALAEVSELGGDVVVLADSPRPGDEQVYTCVEENPEDYSVCAFDAGGNGRTGRASPALEQVAGDLGLPYVNLNEWICPPGDRCAPVIGETLVYRQGSHVTASYIRSLTPLLYRALAAEDLTEREAGEITVVDIP